MKKFAFLLLLLPVVMISQTTKEKEQIIAQTNLGNLKRISAENVKSFFESKAKAIALAKQNHWELFIKTDSTYAELVGVTKMMKPIYYQTDNRGAGITTRANKLYEGGGLGLTIEGQNMTAAVWDAAAGLSTHELFEGRLQVMDGTLGTHYHSTHVAGTIIGSDQYQGGLARGMAFKGHVNSYDWNDDVSEVAIAASNGLLLSNHSYGLNPYFVSTNQWGKYNVEAQSLDDIMFNAPYYEYVCAAGNSRGDYNIEKNGYDLLTGHSLTKNGITVAAVEEVQNYTGPSSVNMAYFSSWGPTDDGRIKPDICAKGVDTYSAVDYSTSSYDSLSGTSMASPNVAGTLLLVQQYYNQLNSNFMKTATLKGLMIHTASETGNYDGPDYEFGWGLLNAEKAADVITKKDTQSYILENTLTQGATFNLSVNSVGNEPLVATLCWTDPKGTIPSDTLDDASPILINDLDIRITKNDEIHYPWKMDVAHPSNAATQGDNIVDNVEKAEIASPNGSYNIVVTHKGTLVNNLQNYSLIISGISVHDFWFTTNQTNIDLCQGVASTTLNLNLFTKSNFNQTVVYSLLNLPSGVSGVVNPTSMSAAGNFSLTLGNLTNLPTGEYNFILKGISANDSFEMPLTLRIFNTTIAPIVITTPLNNATSVANPVHFAWNADPNVQHYTIIVATDFAFNNVVTSQTVATNSFTSTNLDFGTLYYWKVRPENSCGVSSYSSVYHFTTACSFPTAIALVSATMNTATLSWTDTSGATSWEYIVVPQGGTPGANGVITSNNPLTIAGLLPNTCYDFYLRAICSAGTSVWTNVYGFCSQPDFCNGDHFYDTGGPEGNYHNNENYTTTIYPSGPGLRVRAVVNSFNTEANSDYLVIFNGTSTANYLTYFTGTSFTDSIVSTDSSGALTFQFMSDGYFNSSGWDISIVCEPIPACPIAPYSPFINTIGFTTASVGWYDSGSTSSWQYVVVPQGAQPNTGTLVTTTSMLVTLTGLVQNTCYDFYVRDLCTAGYSEWSTPLNFCSNANYCGGDHFYDNGGPLQNYFANTYVTKTIYPSTPGYRVKAVFNSFDLDQYDYLSVYNGPNSGYPLFSYYSGSNSPGTVASSDPSGALTFVFYGYSGNTAPGWDATIICEPMPPCPNIPSEVYFSNTSQTTSTVSWTDYYNSSWEYQIVPQGNSIGPNSITSNQSYNVPITGLLAGTCYDFYVRAICSNGDSEWSVPVSFCTEPNYCGQHFYDEGGQNGNYPVYSSYSTTIYPDASGQRVKAIFNSFQLNQYDNLYIFNGPSSNYPLISNTSGSNSPGTVASTDIATGALTFVFYGYSGSTNIGWDASIVCETMPPCPNPPVYIYDYNITYNSVQFDWYDSYNNTSWEYVVMPSGVAPSTTGTIVSSQNATITGLTSNTCYDFYVRTRCTGGYSDWSPKTSFCTNANYCAGDHFYDDGGVSANYQTYSYDYQTIYPGAAGNRVKAVFESFQLGPYDNFQIFNGPSSGYPTLFNYNGTNSPGTITSTDVSSGALTFYFSANSSSTYPGWNAAITCEPFPACSIAPSNVTNSNTGQSSTLIDWTENLNANTWEISLVAQGNLPGVTTTVTSHPYQFTGLSLNTCYSFYVRSKCSNGTSEWVGPLNFCTDPEYCGNHFYDTGGATGNYQDNENYTKVIHPTLTGQKVSAHFNSFSTESCCDFLNVYNGPSIASPLLFTAYGNNYPTTLTSTHVTGALTFQFSSDSSIFSSGWDISIECLTLSNVEMPNEISLTYYPNPVDRFLNISSKSTIKNYLLYDVNMRVIQTIECNKNDFAVDLTNYSSGLYFVKLTDTNDNVKQLKIMKK